MSEDLTTTTARLDERLGHIERSMHSILDELRELSRAVTGADGHGERLGRVELRLTQVEREVAELRASEKDRREQAGALRTRIVAGVLTALATSAALGWLAGHTG